MRVKRFIHRFTVTILVLAMSFTMSVLFADDKINDGLNVDLNVDLNDSAVISEYEVLADLLSRSTYFQALFQQTVRDANGDIIDQSSGRIWLTRPSLLRWDILQPLVQTLIVNDQQFFQYDSDIDQLIVEPLSDQLSAMPVLLLSGNAEAIASQFIVSEIKAVTAQSANTSARQLFNLKPKGNDGLFEMLSLEFKHGELQAISILDDLQQNSRFEFSAIDAVTPVENSTFILNPPVETDIIYR